MVRGELQALPRCGENRVEENSDFETVMEDNSVFYSIQLLIMHPSIDPGVITNVLKLSPFRAWQKGQDRFTPEGSRPPGKWHDSRWWHIWKFQNMSDRSFFRSMENIIDTLYPHRDFFRKLGAEECRMSLNVNLPGSLNQGSSISFSYLNKLADMHLSLGLEVFPEWERE